MEDDVRLGVALHESRHHVGQHGAAERRRRIDQQVADLAFADLARHLGDPLEAVIEPRHLAASSRASLVGASRRLMRVNSG